MMRKILVVKSERPVNLDLMKMRFPIMAIVSVLHRLSGVVIFLAIPLLLYVLHASVISHTSYVQLLLLLKSTAMRCVMTLVLTAAIYHLLAGIRHMVMDCGCFEEQASARITAWLTIVVAVIAMAYVGVWLW
jgi:succinate dehydrogenase / fumarate reductase, cytochrome b subunit